MHLLPLSRPVAQQENVWTKGWPHYGLPFSWDYMSCYDAFYCPEKVRRRLSKDI